MDASHSKLGDNVCAMDCQEFHALKKQVQSFRHINQHIQHNLHIPFWLLTVSGLFAIDTQGRLIPSLTHGRTTHAGRSPIQVLTLHCCLTSTSSVTGILPLSYWDRIKVQFGNRTSILYSNASLSKPPL